MRHYTRRPAGVAASALLVLAAGATSSAATAAFRPSGRRDLVRRRHRGRRRHAHNASAADFRTPPRPSGAARAARAARRPPQGIGVILNDRDALPQVQLNETFTAKNLTADDTAGATSVEGAIS